MSNDTGVVDDGSFQCFQHFGYFCGNLDMQYTAHRRLFGDPQMHNVEFKLNSGWLFSVKFFTCQWYFPAYLHVFAAIYSTAQPAYLHSALKQYPPSRRLRSSDCSLLAVPRVHTCFGSRIFAVAAATIWNSSSSHS